MPVNQPSFETIEQEAKFLLKNGLLLPEVFTNENYLRIARKTGLVFLIFEAQSDKLVYVSPEYSKIWGRNAEDLYHKASANTWLFAINSEDYYQANHTIKTRWRSRYDFEEEFRIVRPDGSQCPIEVRVFPVFDRAQCITHYVALVKDRSEYCHLRKQKYFKENPFGYFFYNSCNALAITSKSGHFKYVNLAFCRLVKYSAEELVNLSWGDLSCQEYNNDYTNAEEKLIEQDLETVEVAKICKTKDNQLVDLVFTIALGEGIEELWFNNQVLEVQDIGQDQVELFYSSNTLSYDERSTYLPNRKLFLMLLDREIELKRLDPEYTYSTVLIHLNNLDRILHGGNEILLRKILKEILYRIDVFCRKRGYTQGKIAEDRFGIILRKFNSTKDIEFICRKLIKELEKPFYIDGKELYIQTKVAIIDGTQNYQTAEKLIQDANLTIAYLQQHTDEKIKFFEAEIRTLACQRLEIATSLPKALKNQEFFVVYQPIVRLDNSQLYGFEALVRWHHQKRVVSPSQFIPICEETGLIVPLGIEMMYESCKTTKLWQIEYPQHAEIKISVNLSARQFNNPSLVSDIREILRETGLNGKYLKLEITESLFIENFEEVTDTVKQLSSWGIQFSIDDFGTGYSSLSYLQNLPTHTIKLDRSFISDISQEKNQAIASAIVNLGHLMKMDIIAEGIEIAQQLDILQQLKCEYGQGYYFSRPLITEQAEAYLQQEVAQHQ